MASSPHRMCRLHICSVGPKWTFPFGALKIEYGVHYVFNIANRPRFVYIRALSFLHGRAHKKWRRLFGIFFFRFVFFSRAHFILLLPFCSLALLFALYSLFRSFYLLIYLLYGSVVVLVVFICFVRSVAMCFLAKHLQLANLQFPPQADDRPNATHNSERDHGWAHWLSHLFINCGAMRTICVYMVQLLTNLIITIGILSTAVLFYFFL